MSGALDGNDVAFVRRRFGADLAWGMAAPRGGNGLINPHQSLFGLRSGQMVSLFHVKPIYYETRRGNWRPLSNICAHHGNKRIVLLPLAAELMSPRFLQWLAKRQGLLGEKLTFGYPRGLYWGAQPHDLAAAVSTTFYPDPNVEATSVDGAVWSRGGAGGAWSTTHDAATGTNADDSTANIESTKSANVSTRFEIRRGFWLFDTSSLGAAATITAATFSLYITATNDGDNDGDDWVNVVQSSPASNTALATADYDQCGSISNPTEGSSRIDIGAISTSAYSDWALDATGLGWVSKTSITKLGTREGHDAINSAIATSTTNSITNDTADQSGTGTDPKLVVVYTLPGNYRRDYPLLRR